MQLVEQHIIKKGSEKYQILDKEAFKSKNLYNATLYAVRKEFFETGKFLRYEEVYKRFKNEKQPDYYALPTKVSQQTMKMVNQNFYSFFKALKAYKENPSKFHGRPRIPKYLDKEKGRYLITYTQQAISKTFLTNNGIVKLSGIDVSVPTKVKYDAIQQVRVVKRLNAYIIEVVYDDGINKEPLSDNGRYASIDLGVTNFATVVSNIKGFVPFVIDGGKIKSINRFYNKKLAEYKSILDKRNKKKFSKRTRALTEKRNKRVKDYMHKASRMVVNQLVSNNINTLIVGNNKGWKQDINIGKVNNQKFVQIPYDMFMTMLKYKCEKEGIVFKKVNESHTSKCSFLDGEEVRHHDKYVGRRVKRGLFKTGKGRLINADVNGAYNIMVKCMPDAFKADGVLGVLVHPRIIKMIN